MGQRQESLNTRDIDTASQRTRGLTVMIDIIALILDSPFLQRALIGALLIAIVASSSGTFLVFRGLSFMTSGAAHAALGGAALGFYLQATGIAPWFDPIIGALLFAVLVAVVTGYAGESGIAEKMEVAVGVSFAFSMSLAVFLMYYIPSQDVLRIWAYLVGDILLLTDFDIVTLAATTAILVFIMAMFGKEFIYVSVDMEGSIAHGMNARAYHYLMLIISALAIALATKAVGAILVYAIMVAPAAASNEVLRTVRGVVVAVFCIALLSELIGISLSFIIRVSPSAMAGIIASLSYIVGLYIKRVRERVGLDDLEDKLKEFETPPLSSIHPSAHGDHSH
ncbi:MAG: metal ABC transporter permease [Candidatus Thorarchaeota archaeon]|nr:metal ABC transporter permease [Candidatus Thorarchaeota archaeon]